MTCTRMVRAALPTLLLLVVLAGNAPAADSGLAGDWPGWIYFETEGDLPMRFQLEDSEEGLAAYLDLPVQKSFDVLVQSVEWAPPHLTLERTSSSGTKIRFTGTVESGVYRGNVAWGEAAGTFEFLRSALPIADTDLADAQDVVGHYRFPDGEPIVVTARGWGELVLRAWTTGEPRTLFPMEDGTFFVGRALYAADTVTARVRPVRNPGGGVTHLEWSPVGSEPQMAKRLAMTSEDVWFVADGDTLRGTIQLTDEPGERPGVVILGGGTWEGRETISFWSDMLAVMGFVTLSYDKRGYGQSNGEQVVSFDRTAKDGIAAVEFLRRRPEVSKAQVGLLGISRGGWTAPIAATESDAVSFLMLLVPPAVSPVEQETQSRLDQMRMAGYSSDDVNEAAMLLGLGWGFMRTGNGWDEYAAARQAAVDKGFPDYLFESDSPDSSEWEWGRLNMFYEPLPTLVKVQCPVVAIFGQRDVHVSERINKALLERALATGGNSDVMTYTVPGAGHNLGRPSDAPIHLSNGVGDEGFTTLWRWSKARFPELP
jgi:pimeloyl-ACP methyl ester carboxylesterase